MRPVERVAEALAAAGCKTRNQRDWTCPVPEHDDTNPSLSLSEGRRGQALVTCHAGCDYDAILAALGLTRADMWPSPQGDDDWTPAGPAVATYRYVDKAGKLVMGVCRTADKQFRQWRPDPANPDKKLWGLGDAKRKLVPYRLPEVLAAVSQGRPVFVVEGEKDADAIVRAGGDATCNPMGAGKWRDQYSKWFEGADVVVVADRDEAGRAHAVDVARSLARVAASVRIVEAAEGKDAADHLAAGKTLDELVPPAWVEGMGGVAGIVEGTAAAAGVVEGTASLGGGDIAVPDLTRENATLADVEEKFRAHHRHGDLVALRATLAAYAANRYLPGDPVWLGLVAGSSTGKTETATSLVNCPGVLIKSTISGEAALLSGTAEKDRTVGATGGILRQLGPRGVLVLKDFTTILSMHPDKRGAILSALREIYDGYWSRDVGTGGGQTLSWPEGGRGKLGIIMCSTTAYDRAYSVIALMGDRFLLVRLDDSKRGASALAALEAAGGEQAARDAIADAVAGLLGHEPTHPPLEATAGDQRRLADLADFVTMARSPVDRDHKGELVLVLDPEGPYRFVKELHALWRACGMLGLDRTQAWEVALRVARDSLPRLRWKVLKALADKGEQSTNAVSRAVHHPAKTARRTLEDLTAHGVVERRTLQLVGAAAEDRWNLAEQYRDVANLLVNPGTAISDPPREQVVAHAQPATIAFGAATGVYGDTYGDVYGRVATDPVPIRDSVQVDHQGPGDLFDGHDYQRRQEWR